MGQNIRWTSKKVRIPPGELLLTDGRCMIRARCGNRIVARLTRAEVSSGISDPDSMQEMMFDTPLPSIAQLPPALQPVLTPGVTLRDLWKGEPPPVEYTPEPGTMVLVATGLFADAAVALQLTTLPSGRRRPSHIVGSYRAANDS